MDLKATDPPTSSSESSSEGLGSLENLLDNDWLWRSAVGVDNDKWHYPLNAGQGELFLLEKQLLGFKVVTQLLIKDAETYQGWLQVTEEQIQALRDRMPSDWTIAIGHLIKGSSKKLSFVEEGQGLF